MAIVALLTLIVTLFKRLSLWKDTVASALLHVLTMVDSNALDNAMAELAGEELIGPPPGEKLRGPSEVSEAGVQRRDTRPLKWSVKQNFAKREGRLRGRLAFVAPAMGNVTKASGISLPRQSSGSLPSCSDADAGQKQGSYTDDFLLDLAFGYEDQVSGKLPNAAAHAEATCTSAQSCEPGCCPPIAPRAISKMK